MTQDNSTRRIDRVPNPLRNDMAQERRARGLSLKRAAHLLGVAPQTLENYERGRYVPRLITALKLQILYRGQLASFYQPLYARLTAEVRAAEQRYLRRGGQ